MFPRYGSSLLVRSRFGFSRVIASGSSRYFFTVSRDMPSFFAICRLDSPCRFQYTMSITTSRVFTGLPL
ncbi:MAG: hypothetical protein BWX71_02873 [Deltaproteobacteria bacterium ADurb.Bin072]|nr:MAG: hypothetical protein BWX71_02873 [Deltaproteobacteria bacterium ADurb.Bin072]